MQTKVMRSPITQAPTVYVFTQQIAACEHFSYDLTVLKQAYNQELLSQGVDAHVEACKQIRTPFQDNLLVDTWVAAEGPISAAVAAAIILIIKLVAVTIATIVILCAAASFVEKVFPTAKFYAPDGKVFTSLAEYITYMQGWNQTEGNPYTCMYCGQGFSTTEERDQHQENCPWKEGPPSPPFPDWATALIALVGIIGGTIVVAKIADQLKPR